MGLREEKRDRTRTQLLEAALALFSRKGFAETTLGEIAADVGVSTRTLLRYFASKEDIVTSWVEDGIDIFRGELATRVPKESATDALRRAARAMLASYDERPQHFLAIEMAIASSPDISARKQLQMEMLAREAGAELARRAGGSARAALVADVHVGTTMALVRAAVRAWVASGAKKPLVDLFDEAVSVTR